MKLNFLTGFVVFIASLSAFSAQVEFTDLMKLKTLNSTEDVVSDGNIVKRGSLGTTQSFCGGYVHDYLSPPMTDPVNEDIPYTIVTRMDNDHGALRHFAIFAEDKNGFAAGSFYCIVFADKNLSLIEILQKHAGNLIKVHQ